MTFLAAMLVTNAGATVHLGPRDKMSRSIGHSLLILGVSFFASWTVFSYAMVFSASGFSVLKTWSFVPVVIGLVIGSLCIGSNETIQARYIEYRSGPLSTFDARWDTAWVLLVISIVGLILRVVGAPYWTVWVVLLCGAILVFRTVSCAVASHTDPFDTSIELAEDWHHGSSPFWSDFGCDNTQARP